MKNSLKKLAAFALAATLTAIPMNFTDFTADNSTAIVANAEEKSTTITIVSGTKSYEKDGIKITSAYCDDYGIYLDTFDGPENIIIETTDGSKITKVEMTCSYIARYYSESNQKYPTGDIKASPNGTISVSDSNNVIDVGETLTVSDINSSKVTLSNTKVYLLGFNSVTVYYEPTGETATLAELFENDKTCSKKDLTKTVTITEENGKKIYTIGEDTYTLNQIKKMAFHEYAYRIVEYVEPTEDSDGYYVREKYCKTCGEGNGRNTIKILK